MKLLFGSLLIIAIASVLRVGVKREDRYEGPMPPLKILRAVRDGDFDRVHRMLDEGYSVNVGIPIGVTPLHLAVAEGNESIVYLLLHHGAKVNIVTPFGSPLGIAAWKGNRRVAELLLNHGADVNARDAGGPTPLKVAMVERQPTVARLLREHGGVVCGGAVALLPLAVP